MSKSDHDLPTLIDECNAIVILFRCLPEYRHDFIKSESPDWHTKPIDDVPRIGLEVVHAYSQAEIQFYLKTKDVANIEQAYKKAIKNNFDQPGVLYFVKFDDGCTHHFEYVPSKNVVISKDDTLIAKLGSKAPWNYTNLDESSKKALSEYVLIGRRAVHPSDKPNGDLFDTYEFDHPHLGSIRVAFAEKLVKLNKNYSSCDCYNLVIIYDGSIPDFESPLHRLMESMIMIQEGCDRAFSRVYILHYKTFIEFDLDNHQMTLHDRNLDRWDMFRI